MISDTFSQFKFVSLIKQHNFYSFILCSLYTSLKSFKTPFILSLIFSLLQEIIIYLTFYYNYNTFLKIVKKALFQLNKALLLHSNIPLIFHCPNTLIIANSSKCHNLSSCLIKHFTEYSTVLLLIICKMHIISTVCHLPCTFDIITP